MKALKIVVQGHDRDVGLLERYTESGKTSRAVIGETHHHVIVEIEGSDTLWKLSVPEGFIQALQGE